MVVQSSLLVHSDDCLVLSTVEFKWPLRWTCLSLHIPATCPFAGSSWLWRVLATSSDSTVLLCLECLSWDMTLRPPLRQRQRQRQRQLRQLRHRALPDDTLTMPLTVTSSPSLTFPTDHLHRSALYQCARYSGVSASVVLIALLSLAHSWLALSRQRWWLLQWPSGDCFNTSYDSSDDYSDDSSSHP